MSFFPPQGLPVGVRTATLVVAAHNSSPQSRAQADYVCDGVDDQVEIQAAIDNLPATGGTVALTEGTFSIRVPSGGNGIAIWRSGITLVGQREGTILRAVWTPPFSACRLILVAFGTGVAIKNLTLDLNRGGLSPLVVRGIQVTGDALRPARNTIIKGNRIFNSVHGENIFLTIHSTNTIVSSNFISGGADGVGTHRSDFAIISNNIIEDAATEGIDIEHGGRNNIIVNNIITNCGVGLRFATQAGDISEGHIISNNILINNLSEGILVAGNRSMISNNFIKVRAWAGGQWAVRIEPNAESNTIRDNHMVLGLGVPDGGVTGAGINNILHAQHVELFMDVIVASATHVRPAMRPDGTTHTAVTSPDVPRNCMIRIINTHATLAQIPSGGNIVVEGIDTRGRAISETLVVPAISIPTGGASNVFGSRAFATVSRVIYYSEANTNITVSVGISDRLGLSNIIRTAGDVFKVKRNAANVAVGAVDVVNGTVDCAPITAMDDFTVYYRSNLNIVS